MEDEWVDGGWLFMGRSGLKGLLYLILQESQLHKNHREESGKWIQCFPSFQRNLDKVALSNAMLD